MGPTWCAHSAPVLHAVTAARQPTGAPSHRFSLDTRTHPHLHPQDVDTGSCGRRRRLLGSVQCRDALGACVLWPGSTAAPCTRRQRRCVSGDLSEGLEFALPLAATCRRCPGRHARVVVAATAQSLTPPTHLCLLTPLLVHTGPLQRGPSTPVPRGEAVNVDSPCSGPIDGFFKDGLGSAAPKAGRKPRRGGEPVSGPIHGFFKDSGEDGTADGAAASTPTPSSAPAEAAFDGRALLCAMRAASPLLGIQH